MRLTINDPNNDQYVVLLNNRVIRAVAADDAEGWVDIVDVAAMAPPAPTVGQCDPARTNDVATDQWEEIPLKRLVGEVTIRKI